MPRAGQLKPESDRRLSDLVSVGGLMRAFPPDAVDRVILEADAKEQRHRALPAWVMAYYSMGMALYADGSYVDVLSLLTDGLSWASGVGGRLEVADEVGDLPGPSTSRVRAGGGVCSVR
jgi:hypothetical protein